VPQIQRWSETGSTAEEHHISLVCLDSAGSLVDDDIESTDGQTEQDMQVLRR